MNKFLLELRKRGKNLRVLPLFLFVFSCGYDANKYGKVKIHENSEQKSFTFMVSDQFVKDNANSSLVKGNVQMTKAEHSLLSSILRKDKLCLNNYGFPSFVVTSKQEKVYDVTYASLIEEHYNAPSITPITYFGKCK